MPKKSTLPDESQTGQSRSLLYPSVSSSFGKPLNIIIFWKLIIQGVMFFYCNQPCTLSLRDGERPLTETAFNSWLYCSGGLSCNADCISCTCQRRAVQRWL